MSSVTTSTTVCPSADQPCSATVGVKTRMFAVPWGRFVAVLYWLIAAPNRSISVRASMSSAATWR